MKNLSLNEMEKVSGGAWDWNATACNVGATVVGAGVLGAAAYGGCLLLLDNDCSLCCGSVCN